MILQARRFQMALKRLLHPGFGDPQLDVITKIVDLLAKHQRRCINVHTRRGSGASRGRRIARGVVRPSSRAAVLPLLPQARAAHPLARRLLLLQSPRQQWSVVASLSLCLCLEALVTSTFRGAGERMLSRSQFSGRGVRGIRSHRAGSSKSYCAPNITQEIKNRASLTLARRTTYDRVTTTAVYFARSLPLCSRHPRMCPCAGL